MIQPLLAGAGVLVLSLLCFAVATAFLVQFVARLIRSGYEGLAFCKNVVVMMVVTLIMAAMHLIQIGLWAVLLQMCGEVSSFDKACYASGQNYTALGYGDVILSERWRLLGPLEAINGLLLFGLSIAMLFAVMSRLIANRLRREIAEQGESALRTAVSAPREDRR
jgi:hypothetical protein